MSGGFRHFVACFLCHLGGVNTITRLSKRGNIGNRRAYILLLAGTEREESEGGAIRELGGESAAVVLTIKGGLDCMRHAADNRIPYAFLRAACSATDTRWL